MIRLVAAAVCVLASCAAARQNQPDLSALPGVIKSGEWKSIDVSALPQVKRCRVLALLEASLDDIVARGRAVADLMSQYIDDRGLGGEFVVTPPPDETSGRTFEDAKKIAAAMLDGPLSTSAFAAMYPEPADPLVLKADEWLYGSSCQREWAEFVEMRQQVAWMSAFLESKGLMEPFKVWAREEMPRRQKEIAAARARMQADVEAEAKGQDAAYQARLQQRIQQDQRRTQAQMAAAAPMQSAFSASQFSMPMGVSPMSVSPQLVTPQGNANTAVFPFETNPYYLDPVYRGQAAAAWGVRYGGWRAGRR